MKMIQLQYFKAVAETNKMTEAARAMCVTPSAISIAIANLEKELGVQLFDRTATSVTLNDAGRYYLETVNSVFATLHEAEDAIRRCHPKQ
jgi:DNA-binding transcriptional LysR family regulator